MLKTEQLYYLTQVAKYHSINKTAEKLYMTSAAISTSIKQMEKECGYEILERTYRGVKLTEIGKQAVKIAEQILALHDDILALGQKTEPVVPQYELVIDRQCLKLLSQKVVAPGAKVLDYFKIHEVNDIHTNYAQYLNDHSVLVFVLQENEREQYESDTRIKIRYLYGSKFYPVSSRNTRWIKQGQNRISEEEFSKLPKIQMRSEFDRIENNVVLSTDDSTIYAEAILNDYGVGAITKFAPDIKTIDHDDFKIYEPFEKEIYIVAVTCSTNCMDAVKTLEQLLKN